MSEDFLWDPARWGVGGGSCGSGPPGRPAVRLLLGTVEHLESAGVWPEAGNNNAGLGGK